MYRCACSQTKPFDNEKEGIHEKHSYTHISTYAHKHKAAMTNGRRRQRDGAMN